MVVGQALKNYRAVLRGFQKADVKDTGIVRYSELLKLCSLTGLPGNILRDLVDQSNAMYIEYKEFLAFLYQLTDEEVREIGSRPGTVPNSPDGSPDGSPRSKKGIEDEEPESPRDARARVRRANSMTGRPDDSLVVLSRPQSAASQRDATFFHVNPDDLTQVDLNNYKNIRGSVGEVGPPMLGPGLGKSACEQCVCGELAKSKEIEDVVPDYGAFTFQPLFEHGTVPVDVPYVEIPELSKGVEVKTVGSQEVLHVQAWVLQQLSERAIGDVEHFLRPGHLAQLARILDDPEASDNDQFTARELLRNATIAAKGVLPGCQDTGTAICIGKKGQHCWTDMQDEMNISKGVYDAYTKRNLRYSQVAPISMFAEKNTKCNLPAQIELYSVPGEEFKFLYMAKGGGSANKTFLFQQTKAVLNPKALEKFLAEKVVTLGTSACPPYHLAIVIGGLSSEQNLKTVKLASARYCDDLPSSGNDGGRAFRDLKWEEKILGICQGLGIGAQFGGKYFVHDVRVIRLPRHGASCPVGIGVSCSADRQVLAKITRNGVFIEELEKDPARFLPIGEPSAGPSSPVVNVDLNRPMVDILDTLSKYPIKTRLSLSGSIIVARDIAHSKLAERLDQEGTLPDYMQNHVVYYAGPAKTPEGYASGSFGPTTAGRMDTYVPLFMKHGASLLTLAKGNRSQAVSEACAQYGGFYLGSIGGAAANLAEHVITEVDVVEYPELGMEAIWRISVTDFPAFIIVDDKGNDFFSSWKM